MGASSDDLLLDEVPSIRNPQSVGDILIHWLGQLRILFQHRGHIDRFADSSAIQPRKPNIWSIQSDLTGTLCPIK